MINFQIINSIIEMKGEGFFLIPDSWDDWFEYEISYTLWINNDSESKRIGRVKIAEKNQSSRKTELPRKFQTLAGEFFSIGFNEDYYEKLKQTEFREQILKSLNDIAYNLDLYEHIEEFHVTKVAMMREYSKSMLKGQLHRMALGGARLTDYNFSYTLPSLNPLTEENVEMTFEVKRNKRPSSNIHVLIGKNGVGKTTVIKKMIYALEKCESVENAGKIENDWSEDFSNIVYVSFSAFDEPILEENFATEFAIPYKFVGLVNNKSIKSRDTLTKEFVDCSFHFYQNESKMRLWNETIELLESDNTFSELEIKTWIGKSVEGVGYGKIKNAMKAGQKLDAEERINILKKIHNEQVYPMFSKLSSGHKIILLTLANLIDLVEEKTIVFLDEPEEHLHPPLVSAFIKALSSLLIYRNGVGIIATHSPVIVQEVPKKCVWILKRSGEYLIPRRPAMETYGENLGELTTEIFGYEVENSGFHKELQEVTKACDSYEEAREIFHNQLGKEAKSILRAYMYHKGDDNEE